MNEFRVPSNVQPEVREAFRQIRLILHSLGIPLLKDMRSVRGIAEGTSAYYEENDKLYRYTKSGGKLFKELVSEGVDLDIVKEIADEAVENAPHTTEEEAEQIADEAVANAPQAPRTSVVEKIEVSVSDTEVENKNFELGFDYNIGKNPTGKIFRVRWFPNLRAKVAETPEVDPSIAPITVEWIPPTPVQEEGDHTGILIYRLQESIEVVGHIDVIDEVI